MITTFSKNGHQQAISLPPPWMRIDAHLPELVYIAPGNFVMGDDFGPQSARPAHDLTLKGFWIARYPVTALEYAAFVIAEGGPLPGLWPRAVRWLEEANHPVGGVSWREAIAYCTWLGGQTGRRIRLPTEAEWEKAATWNMARSSKSIYPWGDEFDPACCNTTESLIGRVTPVDTYRVIGDSPYGVSDLLGNVSEWTLARHQPYPYTDEAGRHDPNLMGYRVARGGSFQSDGKWTTALHRQQISPDEKRYPVGVRIVVEEG